MRRCRPGPPTDKIQAIIKEKEKSLNDLGQQIDFTNRLKDYYFHPNYDRILRTTYGNNPFPESMAIANWLNANTKPEDGLVIMGSEPQIYFYTKKHCPSRHAYFAAIVDNVKEHEEWQHEFVNDVEKAKPKYFI